MMKRIGNVLFDPRKIVYVLQDKGDVNKCTAVFDNGVKLDFVGAEAAEIWKALDEDKDWTDE